MARVGLQDESLRWMALGTLPKLCHPPAVQVGGSLQRLLTVLWLGPREPAPEVSWTLPASSGAPVGGLGLSLPPRFQGEG